MAASSNLSACPRSTDVWDPAPRAGRAAEGRDRTGPDGHADFCFFVLRHKEKYTKVSRFGTRAVSIDRDFTLSSFKITDRSGMNGQQLSFHYTGTEIGDEH